MSIVQKSLLSALFLLISYHIFIIVCDPTWSRPLNQNQGNRIKAQRFLLSSDDGATVVAGSSLFASLEPYLPKGKFTSLAFLGLGPGDGLNLLLDSKRRPRSVLIEINKLMRHTTNTMAFSPESTAIASYLPEIREEYCPANLAIPLIYKGLLGLFGRTEVATPSPTREQLNLPHLKLMRENGIKGATSEYASFRTTDLATLASQVQELDRRHIEVVFFEMPVDPKIMNSEPCLKMRKDLQEAFPRHKIIPRPLPVDETWDGEHMIPSAAEKFAQWFASQI